MAFYFISDLHFQHVKVSSSRGFATPDEHDEVVIRNINKMINDTDDLFILGDVAMNANGLGWQHNLNLVDRLRGHKHLVPGNHDRCAVNNSRNFQYQAEFLKHFESVNDFLRLSAKGQRIMVSHYPYYDEGTMVYREGASNANKYQQYRLPDRGHILIHGHTHSSELITLSAAGTIQVNVNLESTHMRPMSLTEIMNKVTEYKASK